MTSPDTSAVRAWARSNGYDVADRGRLPADLTKAFVEAQRKDGSTGSRKAAPAKKTAAKKASPAKAAPAKKAAAAKKAPARKTAAVKTVAAPAAAAPAVQAAPAATRPATRPAADAQPEPRPKPSPVSDDRRLVALGEQLAALTDRVAALEKAAGGTKPNGKPAGRFRRAR